MPPSSPSTDTFSVCQFFIDGSYEYVRRHVSPEEAAKAAGHYCASAAVRMRIVERVIITDQLDQICFEWILDKGIVFPDRLSRKDKEMN